MLHWANCIARWIEVASVKAMQCCMVTTYSFIGWEEETMQWTFSPLFLFFFNCRCISPLSICNCLLCCWSRLFSPFVVVIFCRRRRRDHSSCNKSRAASRRRKDVHVWETDERRRCCTCLPVTLFFTTFIFNQHNWSCIKFIDCYFTRRKKTSHFTLIICLPW